MVLIHASPSSIFRSNPSILFERAAMVADAGSAVVEGGRAIAGTQVNSPIKLTEANLADENVNIIIKRRN